MARRLHGMQAGSQTWIQHEKRVFRCVACHDHDSDASDAVASSSSGSGSTDMWNYKMVVNRSEQWVVSDCSHKVYIGTGTMLWSASGALAEFLADNVVGDSNGNVKTACELGAGLGLPSITLSKLGVFVVATDLDEQCPLLKLNCEANNAPIEVVALPWGCKKSISNVERYGPFDLLFGSDLAYCTKDLPLLCSSLYALCSDHTRVVIALPDRVPPEIPISALLHHAEPYFTHTRLTTLQLAEEYCSPIAIIELHNRHG